MVSRRLRLIIVAVFLAFSVVLLTHKQVDPKWLKKVAEQKAGEYGALKPDVANGKQPKPEESDDAGDAEDADADATSSSETITATYTGTDIETATDAPTSVETEDAVTETTTSAESVPTEEEEEEHDYPPKAPDALPHENVDWNKFAYAQYVTDTHYLCNSVMIFETLYSLGSRAKRLMMYPSDMLKDPKATKAKGIEQSLLIQARDKYNVELVPIEVQRRDGVDETWADSYTKLLAFNQVKYKRIIALDSDSVVLQIMDELFLIPSAPVAMPRAYWLLDEDPPKHMLSSQLILLEPNAREFERIMEKTKEAGKEDYDMEVMNQLYLESASVLPHRRYNLLTSEFRDTNHTRYIGNDRDEWNPVDAFNEAKFLHFSDWPVPKPWIDMGEKIRNKMQPACPAGKKRCSSRDLWNGIYNEFRSRRKRICRGLEE